MSQRIRLDQALLAKQLVPSRSQAESWIKLGKVKVDGKVIKKPGYFVNNTARFSLGVDQYVSRAALKLESVARILALDFRGKTVLDVGSSTGGFSEFALKHGAKKVIAVDVGTNQLHPRLRTNPNVELFEQTDIRDFTLKIAPEIILIDVSFISLRQVLPHIAVLAGSKTQIVPMLKPQFETGSGEKHKGVIKNDSMRRQIIRNFENWSRQYFVIKNKADSQITGAQGNQERFYLMQKIATK